MTDRHSQAVLSSPRQYTRSFDGSQVAFCCTVAGHCCVGQYQPRDELHVQRSLTPCRTQYRAAWASQATEAGSDGQGEIWPGPVSGAASRGSSTPKSLTSPHFAGNPMPAVQSQYQYDGYKQVNWPVQVSPSTNRPGQESGCLTHTPYLLHWYVSYVPDTLQIDGPPTSHNMPSTFAGHVLIPASLAHQAASR